MSSPKLRVLPSQPLPAGSDKVIAMHVCAGAREVPLGYAIFPHGDGWSMMSPCPGRAACLWYASHDLGGAVAYNELPLEVLVPAEFMSDPFSCPHFHDCRQRREARRRSRRAVAKWPPE